MNPVSPSRRPGVGAKSAPSSALQERSGLELRVADVGGVAVVALGPGGRAERAAGGGAEAEGGGGPERGRERGGEEAPVLGMPVRADPRVQDGAADAAGDALGEERGAGFSPVAQVGTLEQVAVGLGARREPEARRRRQPRHHLAAELPGGVHVPVQVRIVAHQDEVVVVATNAEARLDGEASVLRRQPGQGRGGRARLLVGWVGGVEVPGAEVARGVCRVDPERAFAEARVDGRAGLVGPVIGAGAVAVGAAEVACDPALKRVVAEAAR